MSDFRKILTSMRQTASSKPPKEITKIDGWHPVNIVPALSKIIEKVLMRQMLSHLTDNNLISPNHHGSVPGHSTQMLILDLHNKLTQDLEDSKDVALVLLDQSKAYDIVSHQILERKQYMSYPVI